MFIKHLTQCREFEANDGCLLRELLHPERDGVELPYSIAVARVRAGASTYRHLLAATEVYYILSGAGVMHIDGESRTVAAGDAILIPPRAIQWLENLSAEELTFAAIVNPPWRAVDDTRV